MECMSKHTGLISSYQLLITAACTNTGSKMKGSHPRTTGRCPLVPRHSYTRLPLSCSWGCYGHQISIKASRHLNSPASQLIVEQFVQADIKENIKALDHSPFEKEIHQSTVDSSHKGPVIWEVFPCHDVIMSSWRSTLPILEFPWMYCLSTHPLIFYPRINTESYQI